MIELRHLKKQFEMECPLKDVNAVIRDGEVISIIGPSGTGKSTLLRCINMLDPPTEGEVLLDGVKVSRSDPAGLRRMGMVFQSFNLFNHMTILQNIMAPQTTVLGRSPQEAYGRAMELLRDVSMADKAMSFPDELSGGQKQRAAIARTLALDPDILLLDEPTSALDPAMVGEVESVIRRLARSGRTMLIVTHEMRLAREISSRVFYMDQGVIYEDGSPEQVFDHPAKERTRRFVNRLRVLELSIDGRDYDLPDLMTRIRDYCIRGAIAPRTAYRLQSAFEELCAQILLPVLEIPHLNVEIEASAGKIAMTVSYPGREFNPEDTENALSLTLLRSACGRMTYTRSGDVNRVDIEIPAE